jgi:hypothetical protein
MIAASVIETFQLLAAEARRRDLVLRAVGSVAFRLHASDPGVFARLDRADPNDIDLIGRAAQRSAYKRLFEELGFEIDRDLLLSGDGRRFGFHGGPGAGVDVDLFIDRLQMCHTIDLRDRIELYPDTIPLADLLLQKLQIVEINRKDLIDVVALLAEHPIGAEATESIDGDYISRLLSEDWGFWYTVCQNIAHAHEVLTELPLDPRSREQVAGRLRELSALIEQHPKSRRWKLRARVGTRKKWYEDVGEGTQAF